jgi:hypothetical protein
VSTEAADLTKGCCAAAYSGDVVALVLGESYLTAQAAAAVREGVAGYAMLVAVRE